MLLPSSKANDGEVYRELEIGQTTKVMKNLRDKFGIAMYKEQAIGGTKNETEKKKKSRNKNN